MGVWKIKKREGKRITTVSGGADSLQWSRLNCSLCSGQRALYKARSDGREFSMEEKK